MKKNLLIGITAIVLISLIYVVSGTYFVKSANGEKEKVFSIDEVAKHPDRFKGDIDVAGKVSKVNKSESYFFMGCDDSCVMLPVKYSGEMPKEGSNIVARGEIQTTKEGKYVFNAEEIKIK